MVWDYRSNQKCLFYVKVKLILLIKLIFSITVNSIGDPDICLQLYGIFIVGI